MAKKNKIAVFQSEIDAGLAPQIQANASIAYVAKLEDVKISQEAAKSFFASKGGEDLDESQFDLFYLNTILVTTGWNKNFDVFGQAPTWEARNTPIHKQFNLEHDQSKIIGHMTSSKAVDEKFQEIPDSTPIDNLPAKFHILTGAVIYRALSDETAQEQIEQIIDEIGKGEWYVSMECLFRGFDYAITSATGEQRIIPRDESSAYLTKHLRQYGGSGEYDSYSIGRALSNITFSGKGLVRKPANPESIIFNENVTAFKSLGYISLSTHNTTENNMSNENMTEVLAENVALKERIKALETSETSAKITSLEATLSERESLVANLNTKIADLTSAKADLDTRLKEVEARAVKAEADLKVLKAAEVSRARTAYLTSKNVDEAEAKSLVELLSAHDDDTFNKLADLFAAKKMMKSDEEDMVVIDDSKKKKTKVKADEVEETEEDAPLAVATVNEDADSTRKSMASVFEAMLK